MIEIKNFRDFTHFDRFEGTKLPVNGTVISTSSVVLSNSPNSMPIDRIKFLLGLHKFPRQI